ncbi:hypothetical protein [Paenibacillus sp. YYML68]|uniref:hypothetical protein n=1 Tax=Paenibacillus sp. YYML68 TaxID=2909250 RepID=UPI00249067D3|nr:hypothetical protein [Paenibacillus sp. YYML68]
MVEALLLAYYACALLFTLLVYLKRKTIPLSIGLIGLVIPLAGLPMACLVVLLSRRRQLNNTKERFEEALGLGFRDRELINQVNVEKESNIVPLEEALVVNDKHTRRRIVMDALKEESFDMVSFLSRAVRNEDSETSHYAVTAILEMKRVMMAELRQLGAAYEQRPDEHEVILQYAEKLRSYMGTGLMDPRTQKTYREIQSKVIDKLIERGICDEEQLAEKVDCELALGHVEQAETVSNLFLSRFPSSEKAYYAAMKVSYMTRTGEGFKEALDNLKQSPVKVSQQMLQLIRYWNTGEMNANKTVKSSKASDSNDSRRHSSHASAASGPIGSAVQAEQRKRA